MNDEATTETPTPTIQMVLVESSQIHSIGHDPETKTLAIRFKGKDGKPTSLYHYRNFTANNYREFRFADSIGSHFYKHIKPAVLEFPYTRIEAAPKPAPVDPQAAAIDEHYRDRNASGQSPLEARR